MSAIDWKAWAQDLARGFEDIAMIVQFAPATGSADNHHVCLVMKDGGQAPWFAAGKGIEGLAWTTVPGRETLPRLLADQRLKHPGLRISVSFCDSRALVFAYDQGRERIADAEIVGAPYRMLYPDVPPRPSLDEFFLLWGEPVDAPDRARAGEAARPD